MPKARTTTLWMYVEQSGKYRYVKMERSGKTHAPKIKGDYKPGSYYLRYREGDKRKWESVGTDLTLALEELKARQAMLRAAEAAEPSSRMTLESAISSYLSRVRTVNGYKAHNRAERLFSEFRGALRKTYMDEIDLTGLI
jgi:hypothetical protein